MLRRSLALAVALLALGASSSAAEMRPATFGELREKDVPIRMSDGVVLKADVLRPATADGRAAPGRFPVVLTQTPYNKNTSGCMCAPHLVTRGYVHLVVDVRGTGSSGGTWTGLGAREQRDSGEIAAWATSPEREWANGTLGLRGISYGAANTFLTAAQRPPGLRALFSIVPPADAYRDFAMHGGQANLSFIPVWQAAVAGLGLVPALDIASDPAGAVTNVVTHLGGGVQPALDDANVLTGGDMAYDGDYYRSRSPIEAVDRIQAPVFITSGWSDLFKRGATVLHQRLVANGVPTRLVMGPWAHNTAGAGLPMPGMPYSFEELELRWFDRWMTGVPDPAIDDFATVHYHRGGENRWHAAPSWPPPGVTYRRVYLSGAARHGRPARLASTPPKSAEPDRLHWQPLSGLCSESTHRWLPAAAIAVRNTGTSAPQPCAEDQRLNDATGLSYDLEIKRDLDLAGPLVARLFIRTNGKDAFVAARVADVSARGAKSVTGGWQTLSARALDEQRTWRIGRLVVRPFHPFTREAQLPVEAGRIYELWVEIWPAGVRVPAGHRLRLSIQPSDTPHLVPPTTQLRAQAGGVIEILHDREHPSALVLPVDPGR